MMRTKSISSFFDYLAPDGSEIRLLADGINGGLAHCTLPLGHVSCSVKYKTVDEIWFFLEGQGELWRRDENNEEIITVESGISATITVSTVFQFRNTGSTPLRFIIATLPPWPRRD